MVLPKQSKKGLFNSNFLKLVVTEDQSPFSTQVIKDLHVNNKTASGDIMVPQCFDFE